MPGMMNLCQRNIAIQRTSVYLVAMQKWSPQSSQKAFFCKSAIHQKCCTRDKCAIRLTKGRGKTIED